MRLVGAQLSNWQLPALSPIRGLHPSTNPFSTVLCIYDATDRARLT